MTYSKRSRTELRTIIKVVPMADNRTIEELLQAPTKGYGEAIVIPEINVDHFKIKTNFLQLVQANPYHGFERENPHTHINNFKRITSTLKFRDVPNDMIKLMMFLYSLEGSARVWYDKEPPNSILTLKDPTEDVQPQVVQSKSLILTSETVNSPISEPVTSHVSTLRPNLRPSIPYPSRMQDQKLRDKANDQREKFFQIFKDLNF
nr:reverse transcriptase domain-containing protein [Tanacetum cinerariifolium]